MAALLRRETTIGALVVVSPLGEAAKGALSAATADRRFETTAPPDRPAEMLGTSVPQDR
jgi:hypothetical protein